MVGVPILFLRILNDPINVPKLGLLLVILPLVIALRGAELLQGADREGLRRLAIPALAVSIPLVVAWLFSPYKGWSLFGNYSRFSGLIPYLAAVMFGVLVADAFGRHTRQLAFALASAGGLVGGYALVQYAGLDPFTWAVGEDAAHRLAVSSLGNTNFVGAFLGIVLPVTVSLLFTDRSSRWLWLFVLLITGGWIVAFSEGGWAAGIAGLLVVIGFMAAPRWQRARPLTLAAAGLIGVTAVGAVGASIVSQNQHIPKTIDRRGDWWEGALNMAADARIAGRGPATFALEGTQYRTIDDGLEVGFDFTDDPHSLFMAFLTSAGVIGVGGLLVAVGWLIRQGLRLPGEELVGAGFFGAVVAYVVQASISIDTVALRMTFWTVAGGLAATAVPAVATATGLSRGTQKRRSKRVVQPPLKLPLGVVTFALLGVAGAWWGLNFVLADARVQQGNLLWDQGDVQGFQETYDSALGFREEIAYRRTYAVRLGEVALALAAEGHSEPARAFLEQARQGFAYTDDLPDARGLVGYARFLNAWAEFDPDARDEALALYERALSIDPQNPALASEVETVRAAPAPGDEET
ncbi:MAG: O-antigen ligase family protein [Actinomycetota bacterium]|nr:O-antigen ligase family protein [Actinomycetota bacterium]